ncbi:MAG: L-lactate dehydrogenase [Paracoccaceae bacterium]|nr:L-lactate dehydrogenase [Paracoccaceae bacterium]
MKIGIVGCGAVGSAAGFALVLEGAVDEVVFVDRDAGRAAAEAADIAHAAPFASATQVSSGGWRALDGARVIILAAGVAQKPGETRIELLSRNAEVFRAVIGEISAVAPEAILLVATNPVDVMTAIATRLSGKAPATVIGTGTILDTARFRALLSDHLGVAAKSVHAYVIGEHGDSEVLAWSAARAGAVPIRDFAAQIGAPLTDAVVARIDNGVRRAAYTIIDGKGFTNYGIGAGIARIVRAIDRDEQAVLSVSAVSPDIAGVKEVAVSIPRIVGRSGISAALMPRLDAHEEFALAESARLIRDLTEEVPLWAARSGAPGHSAGIP